MFEDGLGARIAVGRIEESPGEEAETIGEEQSVDGIVASPVPPGEIAAAAPEVVAEGDVVALVGEEREALLVLERSEIGGIDAQLDAIGPGGLAARVDDALEPQGESRKEGVA